MALRISEEELSRLTGTREALFLGIITAEQEIRLKMADTTTITGHLECLKRESIEDVVRGFSLLVKNGRVRGLFSLSRLNPTSDAKLEDRVATELIALLPLAPDFRVFGY